MSARPYYIAAAGNLGPIGGLNSGATLSSVVVGTGVSSAVLTIYDGQSASAPAVVKAVIDCAAAGDYFFGDTWFKNGIFAVLSGANAKVTVNAE